MLNDELREQRERLLRFVDSGDNSLRLLGQARNKQGFPQKNTEYVKKEQKTDQKDTPEPTPPQWNEESVALFLEKNPLILVAAMRHYPTKKGGIDMVALLRAIETGKFSLS